MTTVRRSPEFRLGDRAQEAVRLAERQRYDLPPRPKGKIPDVPDDITELSDRDLMVRMTEMTRWAEHLAVQLALAEVDERNSEIVMERARALASLGAVKDVTERKAKVYESDEFIKAQEDYHERMAYRKLIGTFFGSADRWSSHYSRELTRRVNMEPRTRRADR